MGPPWDEPLSVYRVWCDGSVKLRLRFGWTQELVLILLISLISSDRDGYTRIRGVVVVVGQSSTIGCMFLGRFTREGRSGMCFRVLGSIVG